jgi:hypothetical protein
VEFVTQLPQDAEFGDYRIEQLLRAADASTVYRARQPALDRAVALHVANAPADSEEGERFLARARALAAVDHPHVIPVYDVGAVEGRAYAATRLSDGAPAAQVGPLASEAAVAAIEQSADALDVLERAGVAFAPSPHTVILEGDRRTPLAQLSPLDAPPEPSASSVAGLGTVLSTLADPADQSLLAVARRAMDTSRRWSMAELTSAARGAITPARRRRRRISALLAVPAIFGAAVAIALVATGGERSSTPRAATNSAPARIAATIPIGEEPTAAAVVGRDVWVSTAKGHLVHIDAATNRVVGAPVRSLHAGGDLMVRAGAGSLFAIDPNGTVARIDPRTGSVLRRARVGASLNAATVAPDALWLVRWPPEGSQTGRDVLLRLDPRTLRRRGPPIPVGFHPADVEPGPGYVDVMETDGSTVSRVDVRGGGTKQVLIGPKPADAAIAGGRLWIPDPIGGVVTAIDPRLEHPPALVLPVGSGFDAIAADGALWVILSRGISPRSPARLIRIDPRSGRVAGRALDLGGGVGWPAAGDGALWLPAQSRRAVLRVVPITPAPAWRPVPEPARRELRSGPATPGRKQARVTGVTFSIDVRMRGWIVAALPFIADVRRFDNVNVGIAVIVPDQVLGPHGNTHRVTSPAQLLSVLRQVPALRMEDERATSVGGLPARTVILRVGPRATRAGYCATRCVGLYTREQVTQYVAPAMRLTVLEVHGRTVAVSEDMPIRASLAQTGELVSSIRFR